MSCTTKFAQRSFRPIRRFFKRPLGHIQPRPQPVARESNSLGQTNFDLFILWKRNCYRKRQLESEAKTYVLDGGAQAPWAFINKGGRPTLAHPIYFFLGRNAQFEQHERNKGYVIKLADLPMGAVSFTYGDSMFSLNEDYRRFKGEGYLSELCPHVYTLEDLPILFSHRDLRTPLRLHIEAQLWITPKGENHK